MATKSNAAIRPWAEFASTLPDDSIESEDGTRFLQLPGKNVAEALNEILARLGCETEPVLDAGDNGWEFGLRHGKRRMWCQVTMIDKYLIVVEPQGGPGLLGLLFGRQEADPYPEVMNKLGRELARDPRFIDVQWFFAHQVHTDVAGTRSPLGDMATT